MNLHGWQEGFWKEDQLKLASRGNEYAWLFLSVAVHRDIIKRISVCVQALLILQSQSHM